MLFTEGTENVFDDISAVRVTTWKNLVAYTLPPRMFGVGQ